MDKRVPDISQCRASKLGAGQLVFCDSDHRLACDYAMPFGGVKHFCVHPQCLEIAARTAAQADSDDRRGKSGDKSD